MEAVGHIDKAAEALADMVEDGHLKDDFELANCITAAQYQLQEAKRLAAKRHKGISTG